MSDLERVVHAVMHDGCEIVRYDRAGKWYLEPINKTQHGALRTLLTVDYAVALALGAETVYPHQYGGGVFWRRYLKAERGNK